MFAFVSHLSTAYPIEFVKYPQAEAKKAEEKAAKAAAKDKVRQ